MKMDVKKNGGGFLGGGEGAWRWLGWSACGVGVVMEVVLGKGVVEGLGA
jgi:hypothetical protein